MRITGEGIIIELNHGANGKVLAEVFVRNARCGNWFRYEASVDVNALELWLSLRKKSEQPEPLYACSFCGKIERMKGVRDGENTFCSLLCWFKVAPTGEKEKARQTLAALREELGLPKGTAKLEIVDEVTPSPQKAEIKIGEPKPGKTTVAGFIQEFIERKILEE